MEKGVTKRKSGATIKSETKLANKKSVMKKVTAKDSKVAKSNTKTVAQKLRVQSRVAPRATRNPLKEKAEKTFFAPRLEETKTVSSPVVVIPNSISLRLKRKAKLISNLPIDDLSAVSWKVAYVSGIAFILFGSLIAATNTPSIAKVVESRLLANIVSTLDTTTNTTDTTTSSQITVSAPFVALDSTTPIQSPLTTDNEYIVKTGHIEIISFYLHYLDDDERIDLQPTTGGPEYHILIKGTTLKPGYYKLKADFEGLDGSSITGRTLGSFNVPIPLSHPEANLLNSFTTLSNDKVVTAVVRFADNLKFILASTDSTTFESNLNFTRVINTDEYKMTIPGASLETGSYILRVEGRAIIDGSDYEKNLIDFVVPDSTTTTGDSVSDSTTETSADTEDTTVETSDVTEPVTTTPISTNATSTLPTEVKVELKSPTSEFVKPDTLHVFAPMQSELVQLFYRSEKTTTVSPLGYAIKGNDRWLYRFDPSNLPSGKYYLSARAKYNGKFYISNPVGIKVTLPQPVNTTPTSNEGTTAEVNPIETTTQTTTDPSPNTDSAPLNSPERTFAELQTVEQSTSDIQDTIAIDETNNLLEEFKPEIDRLLKNYALAQQSGDEILIESAKKELEDKRDELIELALIDPDLRILADRIGERLTLHIQTIQEKIQTFEELRRKESNNDSSIDTDNDGVSDFDERVLFKTDPTVADSDNDGVLDGIEIIKGFDPLDESPEATVTFESPKESVAYVADDILIVDTVTPIIREDVSDTVKPVAAEIKGKGIPNSFVTLYIFSTPTVVTVKTDADGSFVYTFEDELEDGEHEVYVAVTDNTGSIVAQSSPFRFVKEAQAFTSEDDAQAPIVSSIDSTISGNPFISVAGLGVLGFGLVLLILGFALRNTPTRQVIQENITA